MPGAWAFESEDFDRLLAELPATPSATALWLKRRGSLDACCIRLFEEEPRMGAQP